MYTERARKVMNKYLPYAALFALVMAGVCFGQAWDTITAQPNASDPPRSKIWIAQSVTSEAVIFTLTLDDGRVFRTVARRDGICPFGCNGTMVFEIPERDIREVFRTKTSQRSTGQLTTELEEK